MNQPFTSKSPSKILHLAQSFTKLFPVYDSIYIHYSGAYNAFHIENISLRKNSRFVRLNILHENAEQLVHLLISKNTQLNNWNELQGGYGTVEIRKVEMKIFLNHYQANFSFQKTELAVKLNTW